MYRVIAYFEDLQDGNHPYWPGDTFPRAGGQASPERLLELSSCANRRRMPLIQRVPDPSRPPEKKQRKKG